ncbi:MAG: hypothetical protein RL329_499 [Bacteroidota bacterium]|jgi:hypothetical protein
MDDFIKNLLLLKMKKILLGFFYLLLPAFLKAQGCIPPKFYPYLDKYEKFVCTDCVGTIQEEEAEMKVSWLKYCPPAADQGKCNSCVAWSMCYYALTIKASIKKKSKVTPYSPYFICAHTGKCDSGMTLPEAHDVILAQRYDLSATPSFDGCPAPLCCTDKSKPIPKDSHGYSDKLEDERYRYAAAGLERIVDTKTLCDYLAHQPVLMILNLNTVHNEPNKENDFLWEIGSLDINKKPNCHAVCIIGYNQKKDYVLVVNSRGKQWGDNGFARIRMEHLHPDNAYMFAWGFVP